MRRSSGFVAALAASLALAACTADEHAPRAAAPTGPFQACPAISPTARAAPSASHGVPTIPALALPCFAGGQAVDLARIGRPAVINLWASWCKPCRQELPELQRFAERASGDLVVLGVVTGDTRPAAAAAAEDFGVSFATLFDPGEALRRGLGRTGLPITLFVDADGYVRYVYQASAVLTLSTLEDLARDHLGVAVR